MPDSTNTKPRLLSSLDICSSFPNSACGPRLSSASYSQNDTTWFSILGLSLGRPHLFFFFYIPSPCRSKAVGSRASGSIALRALIGVRHQAFTYHYRPGACPGRLAVSRYPVTRSTVAQRSGFGFWACIFRPRGVAATESTSEQACGVGRGGSRREPSCRLRRA